MLITKRNLEKIINTLNESAKYNNSKVEFNKETKEYAEINVVFQEIVYTVRIPKTVIKNKYDIITIYNNINRSFINVILNNIDELIEFVGIVFTRYQRFGVLQFKIIDKIYNGRKLLILDETGNKYLISSNVLKQAMIRDMLNVVNATINREGKLIIEE